MYSLSVRTFWLRATYTLWRYGPAEWFWMDDANPHDVFGPFPSRKSALEYGTGLGTVVRS
jgi:hypothetical protein